MKKRTKIKNDFLKKSYICNSLSYVIQRLRKNCNNTYIKIVYENNELHRQSVNSLRSPRFRNQSVKGILLSIKDVKKKSEFVGSF